MSQQALRFIRKNGKVIPIRAAASAGGRAAGQAVRAGAAGAALAAAHHASKATRHPDPHKFKANAKLDAAGLGISIASGAIAAATFSTPKGLLVGGIASHALDAVGVTANLASVAGKGHATERAKQGAKQEIRNLVIGNAVYAAGIIALPRNRTAAKVYAKKGIEVAGKLAALAKKAFQR